MEITIAHLYYDLLNLYGEVGNVRIIKKVLEEQGVKVIVKFLTADDELNFSDYDLVYIGMGINTNLIIANKHLLKYKNEIKKYIDDNKCFICTGNSYEMFGKSFVVENKKNKALGIFDYTSYELKERKILEVSGQSKITKKEIIGFMNTGSFNDNEINNFIDLKDKNKIIKEGIIYNNFIGTYTIGPLFVRNPELLKIMVKKLIYQKKPKYKFKKFDFKFLNMAYKDCIERRKTNV